METARAVVLVEGDSDRLALETLARRLQRNLSADGVMIVPMGGSKSITTFLERFGPAGLSVRLAGLCDSGEVDDFRRGLVRAGLTDDATPSEMDRLGFYVCVADLEDELIRALGDETVADVVRALGEGEQLRTFRKQPQWRDRAPAEQLRRFFGTNSGRKARAAVALVEALDMTRVPRPLEAVLAAV